MLACILMCGCNDEITEKSPETAEEVITYLSNKNDEYVSDEKNNGDISDSVRKDTTENGQHPKAVVITCSDSRVPPEHIFGAGIGDLFVIRTAGNVIGEYELGSVEYGAEHLGCKAILVLGHTNCGAVDATLSGGGHGAVKAITDEIAQGLTEGCNAREAEILNVENSISRIMESELMQELVSDSGVAVVGAIYDIETGKVNFLD